MKPADGLTPRQREILDWIRVAVDRHGAPPTRAEIAVAFGFRSPNAAEEHLRALARKGAIELLSGTSRGIRLLAAGVAKPSLQPELPLPGLGQLVLPLVGRVAAGAPILAQAHVEASYLVAAELFSRRPDYLLRVRGESMRDAGIIEGDLIAVQSTPDAANGQIVVARLGDEVTIKRLRLGNWRGRPRIELEAANPDFSTRRIGPGDAFEIEGVMVGLVRSV